MKPVFALRRVTPDGRRFLKLTDYKTEEDAIKAATFKQDRLAPGECLELVQVDRSVTTLQRFPVKQ